MNRAVGWVYDAFVSLMHTCETRSPRAENIRHPSVDDQRCLRGNVDIQWKIHFSDAKVRHCVRGSDDNSYGVTALKQ